jgi:hypothetical protein
MSSYSPLASRIALLLALGFTSPTRRASAQPPTRHVAVPTLVADTAVVATIDGIMRAFYDVISGPPGQPRQWGRDRTLYVPDIRFHVPGRRDGRPTVFAMTHQQYVDGVDASFVARGFFEREIGRCVRRFGNTAQVFSAYESRRDSATAPVMDRGVNLLQLFNDGARWWVASVVWEDVRADLPLPSPLCS